MTFPAEVSLRSLLIRTKGANETPSHKTNTNHVTGNILLDQTNRVVIS